MLNGIGQLLLNERGVACSLGGLGQPCECETRESHHGGTSAEHLRAHGVQATGRFLEVGFGGVANTLAASDSLVAVHAQQELEPFGQGSHELTAYVSRALMAPISSSAGESRSSANTSRTSRPLSRVSSTAIMLISSSGPPHGSRLFHPLPVRICKSARSAPVKSTLSSDHSRMPQVIVQPLLIETPREEWRYQRFAVSL